MSISECSPYKSAILRMPSYLGSDHLIFMGGGGGGPEDYIGPGIFFSTETESCLFFLSAV